jgi:hypothetical protein
MRKKVLSIFNKKFKVYYSMGALYTVKCMLSESCP